MQIVRGLIIFAGKFTVSTIKAEFCRKWFVLWHRFDSECSAADAGILSLKWVCKLSDVLRIRTVMALQLPRLPGRWMDRRCHVWLHMRRSNFKLRLWICLYCALTNSVMIHFWTLDGRIGFQFAYLVTVFILFLVESPFCRLVLLQISTHPTIIYHFLLWILWRGGCSCDMPRTGKWNTVLAMWNLLSWKWWKMEESIWCNCRSIHLLPCRINYGIQEWTYKCISAAVKRITLC